MDNQVNNQQTYEVQQHKNGGFMKFIFGLLVGGGIGGVGGYFLGKSREQANETKEAISRGKEAKSIEERVKEAYEKGLDEGATEATKAAREWIDANVVVVPSKEKSDAVVKEKPYVVKHETSDIDEEPDEDIDEYDLSIDDVEVDPERETERSKYLDLIDRYQAHPEEAPTKISRDDFQNECYLEKEWVTYYQKDNVFAYDIHDDEKIDDPFELFGCVNGNDLFSETDEDDPDCVHIRNMKEGTVYEITRMPKAWSSLSDGGIYFDDGETTNIT